MLAETAPVTINVMEIILPLLPWLFMFVAILLVMRRVILKQNRMTTEHIERMRLHMIAVESKLDRLIDQGEQRKSPMPPN